MLLEFLISHIATIEVCIYRLSRIGASQVFSVSKKSSTCRLERLRILTKIVVTASSKSTQACNSLLTLTPMSPIIHHSLWLHILEQVDVQLLKVVVSKDILYPSHSLRNSITCERTVLPEFRDCRVNAKIGEERVLSFATGSYGLNQNLPKLCSSRTFYQMFIVDATED